MSCPFCELNQNDYLYENNYAFAIFDKFPVNKGHLLIVTKRHVSNFFETTDNEKEAIIQLIDKCKLFLEKKFNPDGYNIGINVGVDAGQTIMHLHVHLIPRYKGDIDDPTGGVRGVIPAKRKY